MLQKEDQIVNKKTNSMFRQINKISILVVVLCASCSPNIETASDLVEAHLKATAVNQSNGSGIKSLKTYFNFNMKIGGKLVNSVEQVVSKKGDNYQKTETYINNKLTELTITNNSKSTMVKLENGEFFGINEIPAESVYITPVSKLLKNIHLYQVKDTVWQEKPVFQLISDNKDYIYTFDKESKYLLAFTTKNMYGVSTTTYSDYKEVDGYMFPFREVTSIPEAGYETETVYSTIEVNPDFAENYFDLDPSWKILGKGQDIPDFKLPYVNNSNKHVTRKDLKGKIVLMDFWATWCKPCIEEFPNLKENYKTFKNKGFEVVSISVDRDKDKPLNFLENNPFPWKYNLYSEGELRSELAKNFQIVALPRQILVDENGKIIAIDTELRGGKLTDVLTLFTSNK